MKNRGEVVAWDCCDGFGLVESPASVPNDIHPIIDEEIVGRSLDLSMGDTIEYELGEDVHGWFVVEIYRIEHRSA